MAARNVTSRVSRWAPLAAAVGAALWLILPACTDAPVAGVDVYMHVRRVEFGIDALLSGRSIDPWYPGALGGFPLFAARGPGLTIATALVMVLGLGRVPPVVALNVVVLGSLVLVPPMVGHAARAFDLDRRGAGLAALCSLLVVYPFTEGPVGLFGIGLLENQLGAVFAWTALGALRRLVLAASAGTAITAALALAALALTHTASTVAIVPIALVVIVGTRPRGLARAIPWVLLAGLCAAFLAGFWLVPFLAHRHLIDVVISGHGIPPVAEELRELFAGAHGLYAGRAAWLVGGAWLLVATTWRRWPPGVRLALVVPVLYFASTRALYHVAPREVTEQLARRGMGYAAVLATFPLAAVATAAMRRLGDLGALALTAIATAAVVTALVPVRQVVGPRAPAPDPLPAVAAALEELVPVQGRFSTPPPEWGPDATAHPFAAPDRWLAWASHRSVLGGHTPESSSLPWTITQAERYRDERPHVVADRLLRLGVTHAVIPSPALAARLARSSRFAVVRTVPPVVVLALRSEAGFPAPGTLATTSVPADVALVRYDTEDLELAIRMSADGVATLALPWWPRWMASSDGRPIELARDASGLGTLALSRGEHRLRLRYRPDGWDVLGRAASILGLLALVGGAGLRKRRCAGDASVPS